MRQFPSKSAPSSMTSAGVCMLPRTRAERPNSTRWPATMSPLTLPLIFALATSMFASTTPPALTIREPFSERMRPVKCPSTRSMPLNSASPETVVPLPTKPLTTPSRRSRASASDSVTARGADGVRSCVAVGAVLSGGASVCAGADGGVWKGCGCVLLCGWFSVESVLGERPILNIETYLHLKGLPCAHAEKHTAGTLRHRVERSRLGSPAALFHSELRALQSRQSHSGRADA